MNFIDLLKKDHQKLKKILEDIGKTTLKNANKRKDLLAKAKAELLIHEMVEEQLIYPILKKDKDTRDLALEAYEEHYFANLILREVEKTSIKAEKWMARFKVFKENVYHHIKEEESQMFKILRRILNKGDLESLAKQMTKLKREYKKAA